MEYPDECGVQFSIWNWFEFFSNQDSYKIAIRKYFAFIGKYIIWIKLQNATSKMSSFAFIIFSKNWFNYISYTLGYTFWQFEKNVEIGSSLNVPILNESGRSNAEFIKLIWFKKDN